MAGLGSEESFDLMASCCHMGRRPATCLSNPRLIGGQERPILMTLSGHGLEKGCTVTLIGWHKQNEVDLESWHVRHKVPQID